jgi:small conductance mechanosensitive channel
MSMPNISVYTTAFISWISSFGLHLIDALIVFIVGLYAINWIGKITTSSFVRSKIDVSLQSFFSSLIMAGLRILLLITVAGMLGIQTTSFVAIIGALGLAVGLALQGSLANFAGGVLILVFKPFKVGDVIESQGQNGVVTEIQIFNTILLTPDNKTVILANGAVSNNTIINYSKHGSIRVDVAMELEPTVNIDMVRELVISACNTHPLVLKTPATVVNVSKVADGKLIATVSTYTEAHDYWTVFFATQELVKKALDEHKITMPEPHMYITQLQDVHTDNVAMN